MGITSNLPFTMQGANSTTFNLPADFLQAKQPLQVVWDFHLKHSADHPLFVYPGDNETPVYVTWGEAVKAMHRAGRLVDTQVKGTGIKNDFASGGKAPVVAILANLGMSITYRTHCKSQTFVQTLLPFGRFSLVLCAPGILLS